MVFSHHQDRVGNDRFVCMRRAFEYGHPCSHKARWEFIPVEKAATMGSTSRLSQRTCRQGKSVPLLMLLLPMTNSHFLHRRLSLLHGHY